MTHPLHMAHILGAQCCDLPTSREWLRALANNLSHIRTWWVVPMVVAHLLVHVADIIAYLRRGQTAVLTPVRSGGGDYSVRATAAGVSPMLFGGQRYTRRATCETQVKTMQTREVAVDGGWRIIRQWRLARLSMRTTGVVACFDASQVGTVSA